MKLVLAGGAGALGRRIADDAVARGDDVVVLTRDPARVTAHRAVAWDGRTVGAWAEELAGAVVVNLAGLLVDRRATEVAIQELTASRVEPTRTLAAAAASLPQPPPVWVQMSTLAIYGDAGDAVLDERSPVADGPPQMAGVARAWEAAAREAVADRVAVLRTGIVLARGTPALDRLSHLTRLGLGGRIASGKQWVSWLHERDYLDIVHRVITDDALAGTIHVTSPNPVRNVELMRALRHALRRPPSPPTPAPFVRIGARLMGTDPALALTGRRCVPGVLLEHGYEFEYPDLDRALDELLARESSNES